MQTCDNCGAEGASIVFAGYVTPYPDAAPTYQEWQEEYLCAECAEELTSRIAHIRKSYFA
jgi:predicted RNA-binding Zn-ribbon protein involved in translation (DUF1610 family)